MNRGLLAGEEEEEEAKKGRIENGKRIVAPRRRGEGGGGCREVLGVCKVVAMCDVMVEDGGFWWWGAWGLEERRVVAVRWIWTV